MNIAVFCGASCPQSAELTLAARELGRRMARKGHTLVYGGSNLGLMGEVSGAALAGGGRVVGVIPTFFSEEVISSQPVTELVRVSGLAERKRYFLEKCDAFVALPGGIGTLDEVTEVMAANQLGQMHDQGGRSIVKPMVLLNIGGFFDMFVSQLEVMRREGLLRSNAGLRVESGVGFLDTIEEKEVVD